MRPIGCKLGWCLGSALVSKLIVRLDQLPDVPHVSHTFWLFEFAPANEENYLIYESHLKGGIQVTPWLHYKKAKADGKVVADYFKDIGITEEEAGRLWNVCAGTMHKKGYDKRRILGYYLWKRLTRRKEGSKMLKIQSKDRDTCNEFVVGSARTAHLLQFMLMNFSYTPNRLLQHFGG